MMDDYVPYSEYQKQSSLWKMRWFVSRSKSWMGYGKTISKIEFWRRFPRAAFRYWRLSRNG